MKRYLVFAGHADDLTGGWDHFKSSHDSEEDARAAVTKEMAEHDWDWYQVVDLEIGKHVVEWSRWDGQ